MNFLASKTIAVTGACGTIGSELIRLLLQDEQYAPARVIGLDNNETGLFFIGQRHRDDQRASFMLADVRDQDRLTEAFRGVDVVFHTAALKHVALCEDAPGEAIQTNIQGVQNIAAAARRCGVEKVIFTSSDKAVNPTNVMGTSKLMGERLMTAASSESEAGSTVFASTRFGNVLGSNGSVIPLFTQQIAGGGPVTLTHPEMTRFIMSVTEAVQLVIDSAELAKGGEVFVTKMPVAQIKQLAEVMIDELATRFGHRHIDIDLIGSKPGEKLYEELMTDEETHRALELDRYFVILPALGGGNANGKANTADSEVGVDLNYPGVTNLGVKNPYVSSSEPALERIALTEFLYRHQLLERRQNDADADSQQSVTAAEEPQRIRLVGG